RLRLAPRARPGRCPPVLAPGVGQAEAAPPQGRGARRGALPHAARAGPGAARRARPGAAARLGVGRRRVGPLLVVPPGVAGTARALPAGRAVEYRGAGPDRPRPTAARPRPSAPPALPAG